MNFTDIPGKTELKSQLINLVENDKLPHAMLLVGPQGSGKLAIAIALANYLQCQDKQADGACGNCGPCIKTMKYIHPDIHFAYPCGKIEKKKREDIISTDFLKQWRESLQLTPYLSLQDWREKMGDPSSVPNINVKECRDILRKLGLQTFEDGYKVQIIWQSQFLWKEGNRLLKLIEEPTPNTILILIAENEDMLLNTIVSRCQIFRVKKFNDDEIKTYLESAGATVIPEQTYFLADGNMAKAIKCQDESLAEFSEMVLNWMRAAWKQHPDLILPFTDQFAALSRDKRNQFLEYCIHFFRQYLIYLYTKDHTKIRLSDKEKDAVMKLVNFIDMEKARQMLSIIEEGIVLLNRNINAKILFTKYTLAIAGILKPTAA